MTGISFHPVSDTDHDMLWSLLRPVFRAGDTYAIDPDISEADAVTYWTAHHAYMAILDGNVVGTFYIRPNQQGCGAHICNCGYITGRGTEGKGVARAMLAYSLKQAKTLGFEAMQFNFVLANNSRAVDTWRRAGFDEIGRIPRAFKIADGYTDALIFYRAL